MSSITRPRPSLSCTTCRRRKVRCGREAPSCSNCLRMNEECAYENDFHSRRSTIRPKDSKLQDGHWAKPSIDDTTTTTTTTSTSSSTTSSSSFYPHSNHPPSAITPSYANVGFREANNVLTEPPPWDNTGDGALLGSDPSGDVLQTLTPPTSVAERSSSTRKHPRDPPEPLSQWASHRSDDDRPRQHHLGELQLPVSRGRAAGHMYTLNGRTRYVENNFWALLPGHTSICDELLTETYRLPEGAVFPYVDALGLANVMRSLPTKPVCDILLYSFLAGVRPIYPLIHVPTFRHDYDHFWEWARNSDTSPPNEKLLDDPTFLCLMFAVLYCGAVATPPSWEAKVLHNQKKEILVPLLKSMLSAALKLCQHTRYPTLNTLVASLLGHGCRAEDSEPLEDLIFVSISVRVAQRLGLHREATAFPLDVVTRELRRRVWWHIIWLDAQTAIMNGSQTCCGSGEPHYDVKMISEARDEDLLNPPGRTSSTLMLFTISRFEIARTEHSLINSLCDMHSCDEAGFDRFVGIITGLHAKIDALIARIPITGMPEKGLIPSRLANASPLTHEKLYSDSSSEPTVLAIWARIMLAMLKSECVIRMQKLFLDRADVVNGQQRKMWDSTIKLCISYLRIFLLLSRTPAFTPYAWFFHTEWPPLQPMILILTHLKYNIHSSSAQLARYLVDEVIDIFESDSETHKVSLTDESEQSRPAAWVLFKSLRARLDSATEGGKEKVREKSVGATRLLSSGSTIDSPHSTSDLSSYDLRQNPFTSTAPFPLHPVSMPSQRNGHRASLSSDSMLDLSDLENWSAVVTEDPIGYPRPEPDVTSNGSKTAPPTFIDPSKTRGRIPSENFHSASDYFEGWNLVAAGGQSREERRDEAPVEKDVRGSTSDGSVRGHRDGADGNGARDGGTMNGSSSVANNSLSYNIVDRLLTDDSWLG